MGHALRPAPTQFWVHIIGGRTAHSTVQGTIAQENSPEAARVVDISSGSFDSPSVAISLGLAQDWPGKESAKPIPAGKNTNQGLTLLPSGGAMNKQHWNWRCLGGCVVAVPGLFVFSAVFFRI